MFLEFLMFWLRETSSNIRRNRLMSVLAISTVTIGLFILGAFYLTWADLRAVVGVQTRKIDLVVFLDPNISPERRLEIFNAARIPQVKKVEVALKSQVLKELQQDMPGLSVVDLQTSNYLSDELRIQLQDPEDFMRVRAYLNSIAGVDSSKDPTQAILKLLFLNRIISVAGLVALGILGMAILLIIHNAIRLTIFARRREIRIMELVGAAPWFIKMPFLLEGALYGVLGAGLAASLLGPLFAALLHAPNLFLQELLPLSPATIWKCVGGMLLTGLIFGLLGSWLSLSRSLGRATHI